MRSSLGFPSSLRSPGSGSGVMEARMVPFLPSLTLVSSIPGVALRILECFLVIPILICGQEFVEKGWLLGCCRKKS